MNNKILESRLKSISHYKNEISDLQDTIKSIKSTIDEILLDLIEFCPFTEGDIICKGDSIYLFKKVEKAIMDGYQGDPRLILSVLISSNSYGCMDYPIKVSYNFNDIDQWSILKHAKPIFL